MNPTQIDQLRDTLQSQARHIQPVGLGAETVQRRGRRRRNRGRAVVAFGTASCLTAAGVALVNRQGPTQHLAVAAGTGAGTTPALAFRVVDGTVQYATEHFTSPDGVTYALSTAPGTAATSPPAAGGGGQAIYSTHDGEHWTTADQGQPWITDLTEHDGVLYAVGTAPGAANAADVRYQVGTSHDSGKSWSDANLPFDLTTPSASVTLSRSSAVQIARGASATIALLNEQFYPDLDALVQARAAGHPNAQTRQTADGFDVVDMNACAAGGASNVVSAALAKLQARGAAKCSDGPVLGRITWSDLGLHSGADLSHQEMLVSTDGTHWDNVPAPAVTAVHDLVATSDGFLLLTDPNVSADGTKVATELLRSADGRTWTPVDTPAGLNVQAIDGNKVVGVDSTGAVQTSTDGGTTWNATDVASRLPAGTPKASVSSADAGPLGFAVVETAGQDPTADTRGHDFLLFSTDGIDWRTTDLATVGAPAANYPTQVTMGADHVEVDFEAVGATVAGPQKITTVLGTPQR